MCSWKARRERWENISTTLRGGEYGFKINLILLDPLQPSSPPCFFFSISIFFFFLAVLSEHASSCFVRLKEGTEKSWNGYGWEDEQGNGSRWTIKLLLWKVQQKKWDWHTSRVNYLPGGCWPSVFNSSFGLWQDGWVVFSSAYRLICIWLLWDNWESQLLMHLVWF